MNFKKFCFVGSLDTPEFLLDCSSKSMIEEMANNQVEFHQFLGD